MDGLRDHHTKRIQTKTNIIDVALHVESKKDTYELIYKTKIESQT